MVFAEDSWGRWVQKNRRTLDLVTLRFRIRRDGLTGSVVELVYNQCKDKKDPVNAYYCMKIEGTASGKFPAEWGLS
jgi:hypothetical protein